MSYRDLDRDIDDDLESLEAHEPEFVDQFDMALQFAAIFGVMPDGTPAPQGGF